MDKSEVLKDARVAPPLLTRLLRDRDAVFEEIIEGVDVGGKVRAFLLAACGLMGFYGLAMGWFNGPLQALVSMVKVPGLFLLTLFICYPALFVFNNLFGSRVGFWQTLALILASFSYAGILLAAFAPIVLFFVVTGGDYPFMKLLHVVFLGVATVSGLVAMYRGLVVACEKHEVYPRLAMRTFRVWLLLFAFVGTQMAWNLRPFLGAKELPFQILRVQEGNFYKAVWQAVQDLGD